jgi:hypothetical protein
VSPCQCRTQHGTRVIRVEIIDCAHGAGHDRGRIARRQRPRACEDVVC